MAFIDDLRQLVRPTRQAAWGSDFVKLQSNVLPSFEEQARAATRRGVDPRRAWHRVSVRDALGVPAIHRAVALIASTTGMLSVEAYRLGAKMPDPPMLIVRPDPYQTPGAFYGGTAANMAKYGEFVWWIANVDGDGHASALVNVPLLELVVDENPSNRLLPTYRWGDKTGTRYSGANPNGRFVHVQYPLGEPLALRGAGPLQLCGAANSILVDSQDWAANFYGEGGYPSTIITKTGPLDPTLRDDYGTPSPDGMSEPDALRLQWTSQPNNVPRVVDDTIKVEDHAPNPNGAQMLEARQFNNGDAAREFGIPGSLLEYQSPGASLTYQNLEGEFTKLVRVCLQPLYLEPIEQAMSDLLTRSTVSRFNVTGFLRPDAKARWEIYQIMVAVLGQEEAARIARIGEGIDPGDVEFAPVPFAPPIAITPALPQLALARGPEPVGVQPIVTRDEVIAARLRLKAQGRPAGYTSLARELNVSEATIRRRLAA